MANLRISRLSASRGSWVAYTEEVRCVLAFLLSTLCLPGADFSITKILQGVEARYNAAQTLRINFQESYKLRGRQLSEQGELFLRKPGKMRWQYTMPAGKLFVSDGKFIYSWDPQENRAEKMALKETDDMRAPLAFLLGRLEFNRDFREYHAREENGAVWITAIPKSDKLPYSEVSFEAAPDFSLRRLEVKGQDGSLLQFVFSNETRNPPLADSLFTFTPPRGSEYTDLSKQ